ncbi:MULTISPECIES: Hsp20/alpha crystallin family protein [Tepidiphilus]|jgi:HSP20 family protein|uniref:Hsp20/alpha crystallin family protein n=1 Tax=Tepidiphilus TaxID=203470 RepID=UPI00112F0BC1|nr:MULTISPECIES: Hsp20/alpha crystallin family protein [Tepidiphilus]
MVTTLFPTNLFEEFDRLQRELDRLWSGWPAAIREVALDTVYPAINIGRTPEAVEVYAFVPGVDPAKLEVTLEQGVLTIAGERSSPIPENDQVTVYANERFAGKFRRTISLSEDLDPDKVEATYRDGVLRLRIARKAHLQPRRIEIK